MLIENIRQHFLPYKDTLTWDDVSLLNTVKIKDWMFANNGTQFRLEARQMQLTELESQVLYS